MESESNHSRTGSNGAQTGSNVTLTGSNLVTDATVAGPESESGTDDWTAIFESLDLDAEGIVLIPDVTYPHHPSTGMVASPDVVGSIAAALERHAGVAPDDVSVLCATSGEVSPRTTASLLGYDAMASERGLDLLYADELSDLADRIGGRPVGTVLTPRFSSVDREPLTHARFLEELDHLDPTELSTGVRFGVLDAIFLNCGHSYRADRVFLSQDPSSIDGAISVLFGTEGATRFDGEELRRIRSNLDVRAPSESGVGDRLLEFGYRLYAKASGDVVPPQLED